MPNISEITSAVKKRHSIRRYEDRPLQDDAADRLTKEISRINRDESLHIQLIRNEPRAFRGAMAYGQFSGVTDYLVMAGEDTPGLKERIGYYGEWLLLYAQSLGINSCWVGLTYSKIKNTYRLAPGEKIVCYISLGYGLNEGVKHKIKRADQVSNVKADSPEWFRRGVEYALLAPTAVNQQKFRFDLLDSISPDGRSIVRASKGFSLVGYTHIDLGIARLHFELGAGRENFDWENPLPKN